MRSRHFIYVTLALTAGFFALKSEAFMSMKFNASAKISSVFGFILGESELNKEIAELKAENEDLKAQIREQDRPLENSIKVFSTYPLNNIKEIAISAGSNEGVKEGDIITFGKNVLIGKVKKVFKTYSVATTIFDPSWKIEARIGEKEIDSLFSGGLGPTLGLIPKDKDISAGDVVITSGLGLPYGLILGHIKEVKDSVGAPVKEAILEPVIKMSELRNVQIRH